MSNEHVLTTPVGRLVGGSLYTGKDTNYDGEPLVYKNGPKAGQPRLDFSFGVAFPKTPGATHWSQEPWLQAVWALGHAAFPGGEASRRDFSWKIIDGDSTEPNKKMKRPCDSEGYPGHWVVYFSGSQAPRIYNSNGSQLITEPGAVKLGYYVQVCGSVTDNKPSKTPGVYWNHSMVALAAYGPEITTGPDVGSAGFGQGVALPAGASTVPPAGALTAPPPPPGAAPAPAAAPAAPPPPPAAPAVRALVQVPGAQYTIEQCRAGGWTDDVIVAQGVATWSTPAAAPAAPPPPPPAPAAPAGAAPLPAGSVPPPPGVAQTAPVPVTPNPAFTQMAAPAAAMAPPPPPPAAPAPAAAVRVPTAKAEGRTLAQLLAMPGWTEDLLVAHGYVA
jgi:hypothetical protein